MTKVNDHGCKVTTCIDQNGRVFDYVLVKDRVEKFWQMFPIAGGWSVRRTVKAFPFSEEKIALFRLCIERSLNPQEFGLAFPESQVSVLAELVDKDQVVRASATSFGPVDQLKDIEIMETAVFGRLMATVGLPGSPDELYDGADIAGDRGSMAKEPSSSAAVIPIKHGQPAKAAARVGTEVPVREFALEALSVDPEAPAVSVQVDAPAHQPVAAEPAAVPAVAAEPSAAPAVCASAKQPVPLSVVTQIRGVASRLGIDPPPYEGLDEAKSVLQNLRKTASQ